MPTLCASCRDRRACCKTDKRVMACKRRMYSSRSGAACISVGIKANVLLAHLQSPSDMRTLCWVQFLRYYGDLTQAIREHDGT